MRKIIPLLAVALCLVISTNLKASSYSNSNPFNIPFTSVSNHLITSNLDAYLFEDCDPIEAPYLDDLDGDNWVAGSGFFNSGSEIDPCWESNPTSGFFWGTRTGDTNSSNTGPSDDVSGGGNYVYLRTSSGNDGDLATLQGPTINVGTATDPIISFYYHMFGDNMGTLSLEVREEGDADWTEVFSLTGQQQTSSADNWIQETVALTDFDTATNIEFRFLGERGDGSLGNMAIDEVYVGSAPTCFDPENIAITTDANSIDVVWDLAPEASEGYIWEVYEFGNNLSDENPFLDGTVGSTENTLTIEGLQAGSIYTLRLLSDCGVDDGLSSGSLIEFETECGVVFTPYVENFDGPRWASGTTDANDNMVLDECWENDEPVDGFFWGTRTGNTNSSDTGPNQDFNGDGNYIYLRSNSTSSGEIASFKGPAANLANLEEPSISFYYHMYGEDMGTLSLEARTLGDTDWVEVFSISGQQQESNGDFWEEVVADITDFANETIEFRFLGESGSSSASQMAIDNVSIQEAPSCFNLTEFDVLGGDVFANATWNNSPSASEGFIINIYESGADIEVDDPLFTEIAEAGTSEFEITGLEPLNDYLATIQADCGAENGLSNLRQAVFSTFNTGDACGAAIEIDEVPFSDSDSTSNYTSIYSGLPGSECGSTLQHLNQNDVVYRYTAQESGGLDITLKDISGTYAGVFVYDTCDDIGDFCLDGFGNAFGDGSSDINLIEVPVEAGENYYIVVSHWLNTSIDYTLEVDFISCARPGNLGDQITGPAEIELFWDALGDETQWEVEYGLTPTQQGDEGNTTVLVDQESLILDDLESTTNYRFWVRGVCDLETEDYSVWVGPHNFRSPIIPIEIGAGESYEEVYCYGNNEFKEWLFLSTADPIEEGLLMTWNSGSIEDLANSNDVLRIYDGFSNEGNLLWDSDDDGAELTDLEFESTTGAFYMILTTDIAQSCQGGQGELPEEFDFKVSSPTDISTTDFDADNFSYYPNPIENILNVNAINVIDAIQLFDITGKKVKAFTPNNNQIQLNLEGIPSGTYIMKVEINGESENFKVIKK